MINGNHGFRLTVASKMKLDSQPVVAFNYVLQHIDKLPNICEVYHSGRCGRCGRELTDPESIKCGLGPHCRTVC
jgi:hypothetical protein